ncbi:MAG: hypothetical protein JXN63_01385 [Candidatus Delongbacteria bacterium]|nr:hypothetical protein [Candidatus Delongbacteria bacterium]
MKIIILTVMMMTAVLAAQFRDTGIQTDPRLKLMNTSATSFLDMSKISLSHSVSMGYYSSGSNSVMLNEYIAGFKYRISDPLTLRLDLGMSYTPYSSFQSPDEQTTDFYLKSASLDYKPTESFRMRIDFRNINQNDYFFNRTPFGNYLTDEE